MKFGKIQRAYLGVYYREIDDQFAKDKGLSSLIGVYVDEVVSGGAAEKAGIRKGDIITTIQNKPVNGKSELMEIVSQLSAGDVVTASVLREGKQIDIPIRLISESNTTIATLNTNKLLLFGATFEPLSDKEKSKFGLNCGFKITRMEPGKFSEAGIKSGFILVNVDRKPVSSAQELKDALTGKEGGVLVDGLYPNGMRAYYGLGL